MTLDQLPDDLVLSILARCDVPSKLRLAVTSKKLSALLADPEQGSELWGTITVRQKDITRIERLMCMIPWLVRRGAGIQAMVLQSRELKPFPTDPEEEPLMHTMLFTLAGAFQATHPHVRLEVREPELIDLLDPPAALPFPAELWTITGRAALAHSLTKLETSYHFSEPAQLSHLCSLTSLKEARLHLEANINLWLNSWVPPQPGLCALKRLALDGIAEDVAAAVLAATGSQLTALTTTGFASEPELMHAIAKLTGLRQLNLEHVIYSGISADFSGLKMLVDLNLDYMHIEEKIADMSTDAWAFLRTFPAVRTLTFCGSDGVNLALADALLAMPHLELLTMKSMFQWHASAADLGRLRARLAVTRPMCRVVAYYEQP